MPSSTEFDERMMRRALALARRALGCTSPNPMVGAIVAKSRRVIGEGWHHRPGTPHAEVHALKAAGERARGADLYVTLEPCCTRGRTPPCTEAIVAAGVRRVVVAAIDPNPKHSGRGLDALKDAGIKVEAGLLQEDASRLNEGFNKWIRTGTPLVTAKAAMSLDGKIATAIGRSHWITGEAARNFVQELRRASDAVMVGWRTVNADNPRLTVRAAHVERQPWRVIVDSQGQAQLEREVFCDEHKTRTLVLTSDRSPAAWRKELAARGVSVVLCALQGERIGLAPALQKLGDRDITSVLVEGGGELIGALMDARLVDKLVFFYAPKIIGGRAAPTAVEGEGITALNDAVALHNVAWHRVGDDLVVSGYCK